MISEVCDEEDADAAVNMIGYSVGIGTFEAEKSGVKNRETTKIRDYSYDNAYKEAVWSINTSDKREKTNQDMRK